MAGEAAAPEAWEIILFYKYADLSEGGAKDEVKAALEGAFAEAAKPLCGRILLAEEGVNGNLAAAAGPAMADLVAALLRLPHLGLRREDIKFAAAKDAEAPFPDLRIREVMLAPNAEP